MPNRKGWKAKTANVELTRNELQIIKANLTYALQNCPVDEGDIIDVDGNLSSRPYYVALLNKLNSIEPHSINEIELNKEELRFLVASTGYAVEHCPVDGGLQTEDGEFSTKKVFKQVNQKLAALLLNR